MTEELWSTSYNDSIPHRAAIALRECGTRATPVADEIIRALKHDKPLVRAEIVKTIAAVLPDDYVEYVLPLLDYEDSLVCESVLRTLGHDRARNADFVPLFIRALDDARLIRTAVNCLGSVGSKAKDAIPQLEILAGSDNQWISRVAKSAVKKIREDITRVEHERKKTLLSKPEGEHGNYP